MEVMVCLKQVPDTSKVEVDPDTGVLKREGVESKMNPYDLYALETALRIKEQQGCTVSCITMGPPAAQEVLQEAFMMGADKGFLISDRRFAGADVLATSRTLARGIQKAGRFSLIICGRQTTDGDTAQVGPAIAEHLKIPHISWVTGLQEVSNREIEVSMDMMEFTAVAKMKYPCLITVEKGIFQPRLPSYLRVKECNQHPVKVYSFDDLQMSAKKCGLEGSPTQVERIFPPTKNTESQLWKLDAQAAATQLHALLQQRKFI